MQEAVTQPDFIAGLGIRAAHAAAASATTFAVPEFASVVEVIAQDARAGSLRDCANSWEKSGAGYHDLVRLCSRYVQELDRACPSLPSIYVAKASGELEPMLKLWPHVLAVPTTTTPSERDLIALRAFPVHVLGIVSQVEWADGRPCTPAEFFYHDLDHARFKLREDLAVDDPGVALLGLHARVALGQLLAEFLVGFIFVAEAAHEAAAAAGDFRRIERRFLHLGGAHGNGRQHLQELFAAAVLTAFFIIGGDTRLITGAQKRRKKEIQ